MRTGVGIELWCTGTSAFVVECSPRNTDRLVNLLGELIALHQRTRRLRIVTGARCYFALTSGDDGGASSAVDRRASRGGDGSSISGAAVGGKGGSGKSLAVDAASANASAGSEPSTRPTVVLREVWENQRL